MNCEKCGAEYKVLRDQDDNPIRRLCPCEVLQPCHQCKRGKVNHAQLTRTGEVANYACAKHGSADAAEWPPPGANPPSHGRAVAEALVDSRLKAEGKTARPKSELVRDEPKESKTINKIDKTGDGLSRLPMHEAHCAKCPRVMLTCLPATFCPGCGTKMEYKAVKGTITVRGAEDAPIQVDGFYTGGTGPRGTSFIVTGMVFLAEPYDVTDVYVAIPRK